MSSSSSEYEAETSESDSISEPEEKPKPKTKTRRKTAGAKAKEELDSNPAKNYTCSACHKSFKLKANVQTHVRKCKLHLRKKNQRTCGWCKLTFKNRGALSIHAFHLHGDSSYRAFQRADDDAKKFACSICRQTFNTSSKLTFHIRRNHFNLKGRAPYAQLKKVNQVWFEKVMNSNNIIEIRKTSDNMLVMKKIDENTAVKINIDNERIIDVSDIYPTEIKRCNERVKCKYCNNLYVKRDYQKHIQEIHLKLARHHCNNCNRDFKRNYQFIKHVCSKVRKIRGVRQCNVDLLITSVNSLSEGPFNVVNLD